MRKFTSRSSATAPVARITSTINNPPAIVPSKKSNLFITDTNRILTWLSAIYRFDTERQFNLLQITGTIKFPLKNEILKLCPNSQILYGI